MRQGTRLPELRNMTDRKQQPEDESGDTDDPLQAGVLLKRLRKTGHCREPGLFCARKAEFSFSRRVRCSGGRDLDCGSARSSLLAFSRVLP